MNGDLDNAVAALRGRTFEALATNGVWQREHDGPTDVCDILIPLFFYLDIYIISCILRMGLRIGSKLRRRHLESIGLEYFHFIHHR